MIDTLNHLVSNGCSVLTMTYSIKNFFEFMDLDSTDIQKKEATLKEAENIEFVNVSYRYPLTERYVLKKVNIVIKKGQHVALVGANGSGKSTFIKLLLKLLEPSAGEIKVNGLEFGSVDPAPLPSVRTERSSLCLSNAYCFRQCRLHRHPSVLRCAWQ